MHERPEPSHTTDHLPVMLQEVIDLLAARPGGRFLDLTVGGGGHAQALLEAVGPAGQVVGADRDSEALERAGRRLGVYGHRVKLVYGALSNVRETFSRSGLESPDGALIDCGLSSDQLEDSGRGFAFQHSGPLDMRMDRSVGQTAASWLADAREVKIADTIFQMGGERYSRRIARAIVYSRERRPIRTTGELADIVRSAIPRNRRPHSIDPATRTFQAIRIVVNDELTELERGLREVLTLMPARSRVVVIAFHSLEDRIVKVLFRDAAKEKRVRLLTPKPLRPSEEETRRNSRARSARVRGVEILGGHS